MNLHFDISNSITDLLREAWVDCDINRVKDIQKSIEGLSDSQTIGICTGNNKFIAGDNGTLDMVDDNTEQYCGINLSIQTVIDNFRERVTDYIDHIVSYSETLAELDDDTFDINFKRVVDYSHKYKKCLEDFQTFKDYTYSNAVINEDQILNSYLVDCPPKSNSYFRTPDSDAYPENNETYEEYTERMLKTLTFNHLSIRNQLYLNKNERALGLMQMDCSNGLNFIMEHKTAQSEADSLRKIIVPEDILKCIWNSGWLSPSGEFYGCPDLDHNSFTETLLNLLHIEIDDNVDVILEKLGWVKFSSGRWLYHNDSRSLTKEQYKVIYNWTINKAQDYRAYVIDKYIACDLLETLSK